MSARYPTTALGHERIYRIWNKMRQRCTNPSADGFKNYGARGIRVCPEWNDFTAFRDWALANGYASHLSIERRDGALGYTPANCTWATKTEQNRNRRNVALAPDGRPYSVIAKANGIGGTMYFNRLALGWCRKHASTFPNHGCGRGARINRPCDGTSCSDDLAPVRSEDIALDDATLIAVGPRVIRALVAMLEETEGMVTAERRGLGLARYSALLAYEQATGQRFTPRAVPGFKTAGEALRSALEKGSEP